MRNTFIGANRAAWKQTANRLTAKRNRWWEKRQRCRAFLIEHQKSQLRHVNKHVHSTYLHQSYQRRHGCNILPQLHLLRPGSTNSHSGLLCISAYSRNTWLVSGEERWNTAHMGKIIIEKKKKKEEVGGFECVPQQLQVWDHQTRDERQSLGL